MFQTDSMSTQGGSTSSPSSFSSTPRWNYDVFLSFRGEDARKGFTDHLYVALNRSGIVTFRDDERLELGKSISPEISKAIGESRFAIVILSRNYASSTRCLDELVKIIGCEKETGMEVLPVFYDVDPSDVRKQRGPFEEAFVKHEEQYRENIEKVQTWRAALTEVASLAGWHLQDRPALELIRSIVEQIVRNFTASFSSIQDLVGISAPVENLISRCSVYQNNVCMIGIWGMGGLGKTTLARVVYDSFFSHFECSSFISNIREDSKKWGLLGLQQKLLADTLENRNIDIRNVYEGANMIKKRLCYKKVLLILDDVDCSDQLKKLAGEHSWFGMGSCIIITTRDKHVLVEHGVLEIHELRGLSDNDALTLFCLEAFKMQQPKEGYLQLSKEFIKYANGLPLALVILSSFLFERTIDEWQSALDSLKKTGRGEIFDVLKISYDGLEERWKYIFLDVACFFRGKMKDKVIEILETCGFDAKIGIQVLEEKSLLTIEKNTLQMHDLLQEMGMNIVDVESCKELGKHDRLWLRKDLFQVLMNNTATKGIQAIVLELFGRDDAYQYIESYSEIFSKMCNHRLLIIDNVHILDDVNHLSNKLRFLEWRGCSLKCLPSRFHSKELVELRLRFSKIEFLWRGVKVILLF